MQSRADEPASRGRGTMSVRGARLYGAFPHIADPRRCRVLIRERANVTFVVTSA
jgi:hypothetical protein